MALQKTEKLVSERDLWHGLTTHADVPDHRTSDLYRPLHGLDSIRAAFTRLKPGATDLVPLTAAGVEMQEVRRNVQTPGARGTPYKDEPFASLRISSEAWTVLLTSPRNCASSTARFSRPRSGPGRIPISA
jgi:hypothetical protein